MNPRFFEETFGWYHAARGPTRGVGVVICPSVGDEYLCGHRTLRVLAIRLADLGFPTIRFDYHGTGDSLGSERDPGRVAAWKRSLHGAIDELRAASGVDQVALFGLRLGGTLAAACAAERDDVRALVLWSPAINGRLYVREMKAFNTMASEAWQERDVPGVRGPGDEEIAGFYLSTETIADLRKIDLLALPRRPAEDVLVIGRDGLAVDDKLIAALTKQGARVETQGGAGYAAMMTVPHNGVVPEAVLDAVTGWLEGLVAVRDANGKPRAIAPERDRAVGARFAESAVRFGPSERLFGVVTEPREPPGDGRPALVLLSIGANHHVGAASHYIRFARRFAEQGFTTFRVDLSGIGDSASHPGATENFPYPDAGVADVRAAMEVLRLRGFRRFVLMGLCSGGYHAFKAAVVEPSVAGVIVINSQTFNYVGEPLDVMRKRWTNVNRTAYLMQSARRLDKWKKLVTGAVDLRKVAVTLSERARHVATAKWKAVASRFTPGSPGQNFGAELARLVDRGTELFLVYTSDDPGLDNLRLRAGRQLAALAGHERFRFVQLEGPDHTFTPLWAQAELERLLSEHLAARFAGGRGVR